ncbi:MAG: Na+/H+ antiporter NhaA [Moraxellaceae bacterium]
MQKWLAPLRAMSMDVQGGLLLITAAVLAMLFANSTLAPAYESFLSITGQVRLGDLNVEKPLLLWVNDGLMALFFLAVGLEIKKEFLQGHLSDPRQVILPGLCALGGILVPALFYLGFNHDDPVFRHGWAIPSATDIAFALGVLALVGSRLPPALKIFVMTLAVLDDLGAVVIIALFYTSDLSTRALALATIFALGLVVLNRSRVRSLMPYGIIGLALWVSVLKSGVHATLAGVVIAMAIPLDRSHPDEDSPAERVLHALHPWIIYAIVPLFAFANAGVALGDLSHDDILHPVPVGIALGLFLGKQIGIFSFAWLLVKSGVAQLPERTSWLQLYGASVICGIGFTMSLFISSLAFSDHGASLQMVDRLGILAGSMLSAVLGYLILRNAPATSTNRHGRTPPAKARH